MRFWEFTLVFSEFEDCCLVLVDVLYGGMGSVGGGELVLLCMDVGGVAVELSIVGEGKELCVVGFWDEYDALEAPYMCTCVCNCNNGGINGERDQRIISVLNGFGYFRKKLTLIVGHPLHGKFQPPKVNKPNSNNRPRIVNMVIGQEDARPQPSSATQKSSQNNYDHVSARMDQLQNRLNEVLLLLQNNQGNVTQ
ncbi:hypothetical protein Tco_1012622, partial [Tanacetum coccineum]